MLESVLKDMADKFPRLARILVEERDMYMTSVLHNILQKTTHEKYNASKEANGLRSVACFIKLLA